jgi:hypothetical protein
MCRGFASRLVGTLLAIVATGAAYDLPARAQDLPPAASQPSAPPLPLPSLARCLASRPPALPQHWHAVGLMMPFDGGQLAVGEFNYDGDVPAMRATIYGLQSGTADLLIANEETYRLSGPYHAPSRCMSAGGRRFDMPMRPWLSTTAQCAGQAPLQATATEWWRTQAANSAANWVWINTATGLPWRVVMSNPSADPPIIGDYAMTYFPIFEPVSQTSLSKLRDFCRVQSRHAASRSPLDSRSDHALTTSQERAGEAERKQRIRTLIPGLSQDACASTAPAHWPDRMQMTAIVTPTPFGAGPFPAEIFYDWDRLNAMLTRVHDAIDPAIAADALLKGPTGYDIKPINPAAPTCQPDYPGVVKPDWLSGQTCTCRGVIANNPQLSPGDTVAIRSCTADASHAFWAWYKTSGAPVVFLSTLQTPRGINLADYYGWSPGADSASDLLQVPAACTSADRGDHLPPPDRARLTTLFATRCAACHVSR